MQSRLVFNNQKEKDKAKKMGIKDLNKKYNLNEIVTGDSIFCATGITSGDLVKGIEINNNNYIEWNRKYEIVEGDLCDHPFKALEPLVLVLQELILYQKTCTRIWFK